MFIIVVWSSKKNYFLKTSNCFIYYLPVSYTHLDVYKRQVKDLRIELNKIFKPNKVNYERKVSIKASKKADEELEKKIADRIIVVFFILVFIIFWILS